MRERHLQSGIWDRQPGNAQGRGRQRNPSTDCGRSAGHRRDGPSRGANGSRAGRRGGGNGIRGGVDLSPRAPKAGRLRRLLAAAIRPMSTNRSLTSKTRTTLTGVGALRQAKPLNATHFSQGCESDRNCGADPQVRAGPPGPVAATTISTSCKGREGRRGRRPRSRGDCPTIRQMFGNGISKWHWASACHVGTHADTLPAPFTPAHGEPPVSYKIPIPPSKSKPPDRHDKLNKMSDAGQPLLVEPTIDSDGVA